MAKKKKNPAWLFPVKTVTVLLTLALIWYVGSDSIEKFAVLAGTQPVIVSDDNVMRFLGYMISLICSISPAAPA